MIKLRPYQLSGVKYLRKNNGGCLFWEMRLGKTITTIRYLSQVARRILIVGPYSVFHGWKKDIGDKPVFIPEGTSAERQEYLDAHSTDEGWFLINKEAHLRVQFLGYQWDAVVIDECFITNPQALVTQYFIKYTKARIRIILTGTPAPESELQYFSPLQWVNPNILGHKNYWEFRLKKFRLEGFDFVMPVRNKLWLADRLARHCSVLSRKDVNLQKEKIYETRTILLAPYSRRQYARIESEAMLDGEVLKYAGSRYTEMRKICSGAEKMKELKELLNGELTGKQVVIYAWYIEEVQRISAEFSCPAIAGSVGIRERDELRELFQRGMVKIMAIQPETIKFGSCFSNADAAVFFSRPASLLTNLQVEERTEDLSTSDSTLIVDIVAEGTIDEDILTSIKLKESAVAALERMRSAIAKRNNRSA